jgi:hypothetical protein
MSSVTRTDMVTRVWPVLRATSARLCWPVVTSVWSTSAQLCPRACSGRTLALGRSTRPEDDALCCTRNDTRVRVGSVTPPGCVMFVSRAYEGRCRNAPT